MFGCSWGISYLFLESSRDDDDDNNNNKGKAIPLQAWTVPEFSTKLRL
jgi:hypothetical protein